MYPQQIEILKFFLISSLAMIYSLPIVISELLTLFMVSYHVGVRVGKSSHYVFGEVGVCRWDLFNMSYLFI